MKRCIRFETADGVVHETHAKAFRHADNRYGNLVLEIAKEISNLEKYSLISDYLDKNRNKLATLVVLHTDTILEPDNLDEEI